MTLQFAIISQPSSATRSNLERLGILAFAAAILIPALAWKGRAARLNVESWSSCLRCSFQPRLAEPGVGEAEIPQWVRPLLAFSNVEYGTRRHLSVVRPRAPQDA